ncbi:MAG: hypothetical protein ACI35O_10765 [Bacillaceae bacterium]
MIQKQISNQYLNESKIIKAKTYQELELKIKQQKKQWKEKEKLLRLKDEAKDKTDNALALIQQYRTLLLQSLNTSYKIDWHTQYQKSEFKEEEPKLETFIKKVNVPKENKFIEFFLIVPKKERRKAKRS